MSMMSRVRMSTDSPVMGLLLIIIVVTFVFWGVGGQGQTSSVLAEVNGTRITDTQFNNEMRRERYSRPGTLSDEAYDGLAGQVLQRMIGWEILIQEADRLGIEVSDAEIAQAIQDDTRFVDDDGNFSVDLYTRQVKRYYGSQSRFEAKLRETMRVGRLREAVMRGARVTSVQVKQRYTRDNTRLSFEWIAVPDSALLPLVAVEDDAVAAYLAASEDRVRALYDAVLDSRFTLPRRATTHTLVLKTGVDDVDDATLKATLDGFRSELAAIDDPAARLALFKDLASANSQDVSATDGGSRGERTDEQMGPVIADAVFAAGADGLTEVVETATDLRLVFVNETLEGETVSFDDAKADLARELVALDNVQVAAEAYMTDLTMSWESDGMVSQELLDKTGAVVRAEPQATLGSPVIRDLGPAPDLLADAAQAEPESVLPNVYQIGGNRVIARLVSRTDADMTAFESEAEMVELKLLAEERQRVYQGWEDSLVSAAKVRRYWSGNQG